MSFLNIICALVVGLLTVILFSTRRDLFIPMINTGLVSIDGQVGIHGIVGHNEPFFYHGRVLKPFAGKKPARSKDGARPDRDHTTSEGAKRSL